jgi:phage gpG-like protein
MTFNFKPSIGIGAAQVDKLGLDIRSFREPLKRVVQKVMAPSFRKNFEEEGRPDEWEDLSEATLEMRERLHGGGDEILNRSGLLMKTMQQLNIWTITETTATIQDLPSKVSYGKVHQAGYAGRGGSALFQSLNRSMADRTKRFGGDTKKATQDLDDEIVLAMRGGSQRRRGGPQNVSEIPARPFVLLQEEDEDAIEEVFVEWLQERAVRSGGFRPGVNLG